MKILSDEAEIRNIITCLLFLENKDKPDLLPQGRKHSKLVVSLQKTTDFDSAIDLLAKSHYGKILDEALPFMAEPGRFAMFERLLDEELLGMTHRLSLLEPLSIAVPCHYLRCRRNEIMNIRLIAYGLEKHIPASAIRAGLVFTGTNR